MKNKVLGLVLVGLLFLSAGCSSKEAQEFKREYESLNGTSNKSGKEHRTVNINKNNPFVKVSASDILTKLENKETFYVYFGDKLWRKIRDTKKQNKKTKWWKTKINYYIKKRYNKKCNEKIFSKQKMKKDFCNRENKKQKSKTKNDYKINWNKFQKMLEILNTSGIIKK